MANVTHPAAAYGLTTDLRHFSSAAATNLAAEVPVSAVHQVLQRRTMRHVLAGPLHTARRKFSDTSVITTATGNRPDLSSQLLRLGRRFVCVSLHDVAPATWPACQRVLAAIAQVTPIPVALLVVPHYQGQDSAADHQFTQAMEQRLARGDELVLHGYTHVDERPATRWHPFDYLRRRVYTAAEGEFSALSLQQARQRLTAGLQWFAQRQWPVHGFVAPAWLMSSAARAAIAQMSLPYASTRNELLLLQTQQQLHAPSLCYSTRAAWRRWLSVPWNASFSVLNDDQPVLRLALHPHDADHPPVLRSWQRQLRFALKDRQALTEAALVSMLTLSSHAAHAT